MRCRCSVAPVLHLLASSCASCLAGKACPTTPSCSKRLRPRVAVRASASCLSLQPLPETTRRLASRTPGVLPRGAVRALPAAQARLVLTLCTANLLLTPRLLQHVEPVRPQARASRPPRRGAERAPAFRQVHARGGEAALRARALELVVCGAQGDARRPRLHLHHRRAAEDAHALLRLVHLNRSLHATRSNCRHLHRNRNGAACSALHQTYQC